MLTTEVFTARAFRLALAFCLAVSVATAAAFGLIYLQVSSADVQRVGAILVDEAAKSESDSEAALRRALELRLTRDIRRLDYVALFDANGTKLFGDVPAMPPIPVDGGAHVIRAQALPDASGAEPAIFVARRRPDGGVMLLGRSLREAYELQEIVLRALAIAILPTILLILAIGAIFARRASQRLERVHGAIVRIMDGDLDSRLPFNEDGDDVDKVARAVNLMLDEIARLLDQLKSTGDNIAHDLRTPLAVARAKIERSLDNQVGVEQLRETMEAALVQIGKVSMAISAILRISAVEHSARETQLTEFDLGAICNQVFDLYEPLAESKFITMDIDAGKPVLIRGDEDLMREAISNLVDNAIKFTPPGGAVRIEARTMDGSPLASVSDTGRGIPPQERARIFRRFYRGEQSADTTGHGLGLSIAESIARLHGFELTVEDNDPGARFVMRGSEKASPAPRHEQTLASGPRSWARSDRLN
jgi:signal transduction histidine kinase